MRILFLCTRHNSLSQRLQIDLEEAGHEIIIAQATTAASMEAAVATTKPALIVAPMLKHPIPESVWSRCLSLIVHPGIPGDRGPSALDWAILGGVERWGVTVIEAREKFDSGPIWTCADFPMRDVGKSALYRRETTRAAVDAVKRAIGIVERHASPPNFLDGQIRGRERPSCRQVDRRFEWSDTTAQVLQRVRSGDSAPGTVARVAGLPVHVFGAHAQGDLRGDPGVVLAQRDGAVCVATGDGAVWLSHLRRTGGIKLPAALVLGKRIAAVAEWTLSAAEVPTLPTYQDIRYRERGKLGFLHFDFMNGAMSTRDCERLLVAWRDATARPTRAIVLCGGADFWSNGIDLNAIEGAADPAEESWRNILAMNALVRAIVTTANKLVVSLLQGNAGAGGVTLALAADRVYADAGVVLNPHYRRMGGLYGSEYWTYLLPRRVGEATARYLTDALQPIGAARAARIGLIDAVFDGDGLFDRVERLIEPELGFWRYRALLALKARKREQDERKKPLDRYAEEELVEMKRNFFGADRSYHEGRRRFVWKLGDESSGMATETRALA